MQIVKMMSSMSASVKGGQLPTLPTEFCSSALLDIVAVYREEIVRILKSLVSTRNAEIRRLLVQLEIVDTENESTGQSVVVFHYLSVYYSDQLRCICSIIFLSYRRFRQTG